MFHLECEGSAFSTRGIASCPREEIYKTSVGERKGATYDLENTYFITTTPEDSHLHSDVSGTQVISGLLRKD